MTTGGGARFTGAGGGSAAKRVLRSADNHPANLTRSITDGSVIFNPDPLCDVLQRFLESVQEQTLLLELSCKRDTEM